MAKRKHSNRAHRRAARVGASPLDLQASAEALPTLLTLWAYGPDGCEQRAATLEEVKTSAAPVRWVDVVGHKDIDTLRGLAEHFGMHPLALEDVINIGQRPKVELYPDRAFVILAPVHPATGAKEQIAFLLGPDFVISFREGIGQWFDPVRDRLESGRGRIRGLGSDYLAYALIDAVVDQYFPVLEGLGDHLDALEDAVHAGQRHALSDLANTRQRLRQLRMALWPTRDALAQLLRQDVTLIKPETTPYFRDCYDHALRLADMVETLRDGASTLFEVHLALAGQRLNEIMKVLTLIATIFMPLGFLAGLYGMNFDRGPWNMPELGFKYGYVTLLTVMGLIAGGLLLFFRKRGWLRIDD